MDLKIGLITKKRYIVLFFKTSTFEGSLLKESNEGLNIWMTIDEIKRLVIAQDFHDMLNIFTGESKFNEFLYEDTKSKDSSKRWVKNFY